MSGIRRALVRIVLIVVTVWPAVHIALVRQYDVNAWKLAGWGMYSAPQLPADVRIVCHGPDDVGSFELQTIQPAIQPAVLAFLRDRLGLGRLAEPDRLAGALFDHYTAIEGVSIELLQPVLNPRTGMIEEESTTFDYRR